MQNAMEGHTDYIHKVIMKNEGQECVSASEDGTVRLWGKTWRDNSDKVSVACRQLWQVCVPSGTDLCLFIW